MQTALMVIGAAAALFHVPTLLMMVRTRRRLRPSRYRRVLGGIMVDAAFHIAVGTLVLLAGASTVPAPVAILGLVVGLSSLASGVHGLLVMRDIGEPIRKAERMVALLSSRVPDRDLRELGLTDRELDVLGVVVRGRYREHEIAQELFISIATAATHIRNILKKAGLSDRRHLLLRGGQRRVDGGGG